MPILGIYASGMQAFIGDYQQIATVTVGAGGAANVTFSSIPSSYKHLQIRLLARESGSTTDDAIAVNFNSDTGTNYSVHNLYGAGSTPVAQGFSSQTAAYLYRIAGASAAANIFGTVIADVLDYSNTSKNKTIRALGGIDLNTAGGIIYFNSNAWYNTAAITSITLTPVSGNFTQYSSFALYGVKG